MTTLERLRDERTEVEIDGDAWVVRHLLGTACALFNDRGERLIASADRVERAWRQQRDPTPRRDP